MSDERADNKQCSPGARDRLLDAALSVFSEKGFAGAATRDIASKAGVNEVTLFRLFTNKSGLFDAVLLERFPRSQLIRELHFDRSSSIEINLRENSIKLVDIFRSNRDYLRLVVLDLPRTPSRDRTDPFAAAFAGPLTGYLAVCSDQGVISEKQNLDAAADLLYEMLRAHFIKNSIVLEKAADSGSDRRFIEMAVGIFLDGLRAHDSDAPVSSKLKKKVGSK